MQICVHDENRIVEIWVTRQEKTDVKVLAKLKSLSASYKNAGYLTAVFFSGSDDLTRRTSDLLCYNRKRLAELETQKEKSLRTAM